MKEILEHTMAMVWRTQNPNYIIIVKNKAGEQMDFSKLKFERGEGKEVKIKKEKQFILTVTQLVNESMVLVRVENILDKSVPLRVEVATHKKDYWIKRVKKEYRPLKYDA